MRNTSFQRLYARKTVQKPLIAWAANMLVKCSQAVRHTAIYWPPSCVRCLSETEVRRVYQPLW